MPTTPTPENVYRTTTDPRERRRIQAAVIVAHRAQVSSVVRRMVPKAHREEGGQVGAIGVLVALEKYDPARMGIGVAEGERRRVEADTAAFWNFARVWVQKEIQKWLDVGVHWRKEPNGGKSAERRRAAEEAKKHRSAASLEGLVEKSPGDSSELSSRARAGLLQRSAFSDELQRLVDEIAGDLEAYTKLREFIATLPADEAAILLSEKPSVTSSRQYLALVERATAFVRGREEWDEKTSGEFKTATASKSCTTSSGKRAG